MIEELKNLNGNRFITQFYYVYKYKCFEKAAKHYFLPVEPAILQKSTQLLEDYFGVSLVERDSLNRLLFTEFGHALAEQAHKVYQIHEKLVNLMEMLEGSDLHFATLPDINEYYVRDVFNVCMLNKLHMNIHTLLIDQQTALKKLGNKEVDFVIGFVPQSVSEDHEQFVLGNPRVLLAVIENDVHKFSALRDLQKLKERRGAIIHKMDPFYTIYKESLKNKNAELDIVYHGGDFRALIEAVRCRFASYAIVYNYAFIKEIKLLNISHLFNPVQLAVIARKDSEVAGRFHEIQDQSDQLVLQNV